MKAKNGIKKPRGKSAGKINSALLNKPKNDIIITNIKKINNINQIEKKISSRGKNERVLSDKNNEKLSANNINNIFPKQKKDKRPKSYNLMRRGYKKENITNKNKQKIININHINNNINKQRNEIKINLSDVKNKSMNKNINNINVNNKKQKPSSGYNALKNKNIIINKISSTEEKKVIKKSYNPKIQTSNLFVQSNNKERKNISSSHNNKLNKNTIPMKSVTNKNEKRKSNKMIPHNPKMLSKNNKSIENQKQNNNHFKSNKGQKITKEKIEDFFKKKVNSAHKKEKEKNNKNFNMFKKNIKFNKKNYKNIKENNINKLLINNKQKDSNNKLKEKKSEKISQKITQIKDYTQPTLIGLNNIGSTCFINATLQCLSQTKTLTNYFLNEKNKTKIINNNIALKNKLDNQLTPFYYELINKLWNKTSETKSVSPLNFVQKLNEMNPLFKLGEAGDSKDFIIFILEQIHRELKKRLNINNKPLDPLNQYDKANSFDHFFNEFKSDVSIISDVFYGLL